MQNTGASPNRKPEYILAALLATAAVIGFVWLTFDVLLLLFAAALIAIGMNATASAVTGWTGLPYKTSLALGILVLVVAIGGFLWQVAPTLSEQFSELSTQISSTVETLRKYMKTTTWGQSILDGNNEVQVASTVLGVTFGAFGAILNLLFVFVLAIFLAATPGTYRSGVITLIAPPNRLRANQVLSSMAHTLRWWLLGQLIAMLVLGTSVGIGLLFLGVSLWLSLGVLTALLNFVPYLGPIMAAVPVLAASFAHGPQTALYAAVLLLVLQSLEGYFLTPMIQQRAVSLPPAVTLSAQLVMGVLAGALGVMVATPLAAATLTLTRMIYVEDVISGDKRDARQPHDCE